MSELENAISEITRQNIFDELRLQKINWSGRLSESEFVSRIFDLRRLPSHDHRFGDMAGDLAMHRENFVDWDEDWVFDDSRLNLLHGPDEKFLSFLCEMVHPLVRFDENEVRSLVEGFNAHLSRDGYQLIPRTYISGRPIYVGRLGFGNNTAAAREVANDLASDHVAAQITRMETSVATDPELAIGSAKEFVESICKGVLKARRIELTGAENVLQQVKLTREALGLALRPDAKEAVKKTLNSLATLVHGLAELRGAMGSGHGRDPNAEQPPKEVARLAVNAGVALGVFLYERHRNTGNET